MQAAQQKDFATKKAPYNRPVNDPGVVPTDKIFSVMRQQNAVYRNKVLTRKRKTSNHPLRELRIRAGFTLEDLAAATQLSQSYLSRLESGTRRLNEDILQRLSSVLACNPADLLPYPSTYTSQRSMDELPTPQNSSFVQDLPVYKLFGDPREIGYIVPDTIESWITRPSELSGVMGAFACRIQNSNFGPKYNDGDRILLNPSSALTQNCSVLAVTNSNKAYIGRFLGWQVDPKSHDASAILEVSKGAAGMSPQHETKTVERQDLKGIYRIIACFEAA